MKTMTMDDVRRKVDSLHREMTDKKLPATDIVRRLIREDVPLGWPIAIEAVEEILALRDQVEAMRITIATLDALLPEEVTDV
jgi:hypothetical protein